MPLITLLSAPKPFTDPRIAVLQRNALASWKRLPDVEVLLLGDEEGLAEAAKDIGVRHISTVERSPSGAPLVSSMLQVARESSTAELFCIINADILLMHPFLMVARKLDSLRRADSSLCERFVLMSRRWDLNVEEPIEFDEGWEVRLQAAVRESGRLHRPTGSDFFLFPRTCYTDVPEFAIGRAGWDNWMIYKACSEHWRVIDATPSMTVVHQNHDYGHLPGARPHYDHPETHANTRLAGGQAATRYTILDATDVLVEGRLLRPPLTRARFLRRIELGLRRALFFLPEGRIENLVRPKRWKKRMERLIR